MNGKSVREGPNKAPSGPELVGGHSTVKFGSATRARPGAAPAGIEGTSIDGPRSSGHSPHGPVMVEPYLITLTHKSDVFPTFQHAGLEFLYMLEGNVVYRHGDKTYDMHPGDALFFDADAPHGPEELRKLPIRYLSVISYRREE